MCAAVACLTEDPAVALGFPEQLSLLLILVAPLVMAVTASGFINPRSSARIRDGLHGRVAVDASHAIFHVMDIALALGSDPRVATVADVALRNLVHNGAHSRSV